jgi:hypothetical protein
MTEATVHSVSDETEDKTVGITVAIECMEGAAAAALSR